jgi:hypothetical protein
MKEALKHARKLLSRWVDCHVPLYPKAEVSRRVSLAANDLRERLQREKLAFEKLQQNRCDRAIKKHQEELVSVLDALRPPPYKIDLLTEDDSGCAYERIPMEDWSPPRLEPDLRIMLSISSELLSMAPFGDPREALVECLRHRFERDIMNQLKRAHLV